MGAILPTKIKNPPKPRLTLRVGVTGHRPGDQLPDQAVQHVRRRIDAVLQNLLDLLNQLQAWSAACYLTSTPAITVISSLAEGADRIGATAALELGLDLQIILPFSRDNFESDFATQESRRDFHDLLGRASAVFEIDDDAHANSRPSGYVAAGEQLLANSDLLIAVWDGQPGKGRGGTADVVLTAQRAGIPCVWIHTSGAKMPKVIDPGLGVRNDDGVADFVSWEVPLAKVVKRIVTAPLCGDSEQATLLAGAHSEAASFQNRVDRFFDETDRKSVV